MEELTGNDEQTMKDRIPKEPRKNGTKQGATRVKFK